MDLPTAIIVAFEYLENNYSPKWTSGRGNKDALIAAYSQDVIPKHTFLGFSGSDGVRHSFGRALVNCDKPKGMLWETWLLKNIGLFQCYSCKSVKSLTDKVSGTITKNFCKDCDLTKTKYRRTNIQNIILDTLKSSNGCTDCGEKDPICLEFDHIDPNTKEFNIGDSYSRAENLVLKELEKCQIVCANCHRKRTANAFKYYKIDV